MFRIFSSVQFSHSVVSSSLRPHGLQHARLPHPSPAPRTYLASFHVSICCCCCSSHEVMPHSLQPHEKKHARLPCPSPTSGSCSNSCPLSWWWHPTISSSVIPLSSCLQFFSASGCFQMSQLFTSGGQSIGASASASILPVSIQDWFPLGLTGWISLQSKGLSRAFSNTTIQKHQFFGSQPSFWSNSHIYTWLLQKSWLWLYGPLLAKGCLCFLKQCQALI